MGRGTVEHRCAGTSLGERDETQKLAPKIEEEKSPIGVNVAEVGEVEVIK